MQIFLKREIYFTQRNSLWVVMNATFVCLQENSTEHLELVSLAVFLINSYLIGIIIIHSRLLSNQMLM